MPTIEALLNDAGITATELSRRANVNYSTVKKALNADNSVVQRTKVFAMLKVLNELLGTNYKPDEIDGITLQR